MVNRVAHVRCHLCLGTGPVQGKLPSSKRRPGVGDHRRAVNNPVHGCRSPLAGQPRHLHGRPAGRRSRLWEQVARRGGGWSPPQPWRTSLIPASDNPPTHPVLGQAPATGFHVKQVLTLKIKVCRLLS